MSRALEPCERVIQVGELGRGGIVWLANRDSALANGRAAQIGLHFEAISTEQVGLLVPCRAGGAGRVHDPAPLFNNAAREPDAALGVGRCQLVCLNSCWVALLAAAQQRDGPTGAHVPVLWLGKARGTHDAGEFVLLGERDAIVRGATLLSRGASIRASP